LLIYSLIKDHVILFKISLKNLKYLRTPLENCFLRIKLCFTYHMNLKNRNVSIYLLNFSISLKNAYSKNQRRNLDK